MIAAITGQLVRVAEPYVYVQVGPLLYELLVPAADVEAHRSAVNGADVTLHTLMYIEGDPNRGNLEPRLLGFVRADDKKFFELFTEVKGIGPRKALKALTASVGEIAGAIESRDLRFLSKLDGIGKRTAELIVAQLAGKAGRFAGADALPAKNRATPASATRFSQAEEDAIALIVSGGERRADAEQLLARAKARNPDLKTTEALWQEMLRLRS
jgi:Holliday junction DNA helicase RuvA